MIDVSVDDKLLRSYLARLRRELPNALSLAVRQTGAYGLRVVASHSARSGGGEIAKSWRWRLGAGRLWGTLRSTHVVAGVQEYGKQPKKNLIKPLHGHKYLTIPLRRDVQVMTATGLQIKKSALNKFFRERARLMRRFRGSSVERAEYAKTATRLAGDKSGVILVKQARNVALPAKHTFSRKAAPKIQRFFEAKINALILRLIRR